MRTDSLKSLLIDAVQSRLDMLDAEHFAAVRLFNGFTEGCPDLVIDLYARAAVFHNYANPPERALAILEAAQQTVSEVLPWVTSGLIKTRAAASDQLRRGLPVSNRPLPRRVREHELWYAIDLTLHQDCSLYLDTRNLRQWAEEHLKGKTVLNAFAYTGSLGVAALGGGASRVAQLDRTRRFLELAQASYALNGFPVHSRDFVVGDFFRKAGGMRRARQTFDCVMLDPPFFSSSSVGTVDQQTQSARLINKVRPLVNPGGTLVAVNNAVFLSGSDYMRVLEGLCRDGHMQLSDLIPVPDDFIGFAGARTMEAITDPSPFNHSTKIAILNVL